MRRFFALPRLLNFVPKRTFAINYNNNKDKDGRMNVNDKDNLNSDKDQNKDSETHGFTEKVSEFATKITDTISQAAEKIGIKGSSKDSYGSTDSGSSSSNQGSS